MRLTRPRFILRWLMVAVAVAGVTFASTIWANRRAEHFQELAEFHTLLGMGEHHGRNAPEEVESLLRHRHLAGKYWRAARYPWLPVAPDPPE